GDRLRFTGYVDAEALPAWYSAADLFVYPSLYEGFGLPPLEAMACGTPVITSDVSSLPEVVGDAGLTVPPTDEMALAEAMRRVLGDPAIGADLRKRGLERAKRFSWEQTAALTVAAYRDAAG
ncbi:MAG: glycosyltransferase family 4 protein, partial [Chloroflexota bacterium]|nr:glycosyltransferase family 4 protein [Chloroflexota bacterium]